MRRKLLFATLLASLIAGAFAVFSMSASAQLRTFLVKLPTGNTIRVTVDAPAGVPMDQVPGLPGTPIQELTPPGGGDSAPDPGSGGGTQGGEKPSTPTPSSGGGDNGSSGGGDKGDKPSSNSGSDQKGDRGEKKPDRPTNEPRSQDEKDRAKKRKEKNKDRKDQAPTPDRNSDGSPTRNNPTFFDALPTATPGTAVPNFVIRKFQVPIFLLPIYQAAGIQYGIRWEILAAINEIETDYGRNLNVSSAGALGWMQFIPSSWRMYGVDANDDGKKDPYNPVDAIFAAARYLKAAGAEKDLRRAIFAYNHADWYVDSVMLRAKLIAGVPGDLVGSLTGLTQGRFPVATRARYADDVLERELKRRVKRGENAAAVLEDADRRSIDIFSDNGAPVVASNDGVIKKIGQSKELGNYIVLQDVYGNQYTYSGLGSVSELYPVPKVDLEVDDNAAQAVSANGDPHPDGPASAGRQADDSDTRVSKPTDGVETDSSPAKGTVTYKPRIFAHPYRPNPRKNGAVEQIFNRATSQKGFATYKGLFAHVYGLNAENAALRPLKKGSRVIAGTLLGRVGRPDAGKAAHLTFAIRPAGRGAPTIDPKPILDGWKLLESTAIYRSNGKNALYSSSDAFSIGQILLLPKPLLQKRVLSDPRVEIYPAGRSDIRSGQIDRRVLATLEFLAESGLRPTVTSLRSGHSKFTTSGNVSHHWSGSAVDIAQINGVPIIGHQDKGGITEQSVKRLMLLQGTMRPDQIISLLDYGSNTLSMGDHDDHIHVGFRPLFGENAKLGAQTAAVLKPGQWNSLIDRLRELENPVVPTKPSRYALPADKKKQRSSGAHRGE